MLAEEPLRRARIAGRTYRPVLAAVALITLLGCAATPAPTTRPLAWVLWAEGQYSGSPTMWRFLRVYERLNECQEETHEFAKLAASMPDVRERIGSTVVSATPDGDLRTRYLCLPDTMDP